MKRSGTKPLFAWHFRNLIFATSWCHFISIVYGQFLCCKRIRLFTFHAMLLQVVMTEGFFWRLFILYNLPPLIYSILTTLHRIIIKSTYCNKCMKLLPLMLVLHRMLPSCFYVDSHIVLKSSTFRFTLLSVEQHPLIKYPQRYPQRVTILSVAWWPGLVAPSVEEQVIAIVTRLQDVVILDVVIDENLELVLQCLQIPSWWGQMWN